MKCNVKDGLICLNKNQGLEQQCFDYEIKVFCCVGKNSSNTTHCATTTATMSVSPNTKQTTESFLAGTITSKIPTPASSPIIPAQTVGHHQHYKVSPEVLSTTSTTSPLQQPHILLTLPALLFGQNGWTLGVQQQVLKIPNRNEINCIVLCYIFCYNCIFHN